MSSWDDIYELLKWIDENDIINLFSLLLITRLESKAFYPIHHDKGFILLNLLNLDGHYNTTYTSQIYYFEVSNISYLSL